MFAFAQFYRTQEDKIPIWSEHFESELNNAFIENKDIIIMGDFNIDLLRPHEIPNRWSEIIEGFFLIQLIKEPTRVSDKGESLLDQIYVISPQNMHSQHVPKTGMSVHFAACMVHST